jgi:short-subunit dehydrogenase
MSTPEPAPTRTVTARRTALITGASSGFGSLFAETFAADGFDVVLVARSVEPMETLADRIRSRTAAQVTVIGHDLSEPGAAASLMSDLAARGLTTDALVNNAGFSTYGPFAEMNETTMTKLLMVNVVAMTELARACLPGMLERRWGRVLLLGSVGSFSAAPMTAAYAATKAYVLSLGLALHDEVKGSGVTVTTLCPGPTATGFQERADMHDSALVQSGLDSAEAVVDKGYAAMKAGKPYVVTGTSSRLFAFGTRLVPRTTAARIAGNAQRRIG